MCRPPALLIAASLAVDGSDRRALRHCWHRWLPPIFPEHLAEFRVLILSSCQKLHF